MYTACAHVRHTWAQMQQKCVPMYVYLYNTIQGQFVASTAPSEVAPNWTPDPCNTSCTGWSAAEPYEGRVSLSIHTDQTLGHIMYIHGHMIHIHGLSTPTYMGTQYSTVQYMGGGGEATVHHNPPPPLPPHPGLMQWTRTHDISDICQPNLLH